MVGARLVSCWFVLLPGQSGVQHSRALTPAPAAEIVAAVEATIAAAPFACGVIMRRGTALLSAGELTAHLAEMIAEWHNAVGPMMPADTTINQAPACLFDGGTVARRTRRGALAPRRSSRRPSAGANWVGMTRAADRTADIATR